MNIIQSIIFGTCLALLINVPLYIRQRRLLRLAKARLEISKAVTVMDKLMLDGKIKAGDVCHDKLYQAMLRTQYATKLYFPWKFWVPPTPESRELHKKLHKELSEHGELASALGQFVSANMNALHNGQPFVARIFALYVLIFCGGLRMLLAGILSVVRIHAVCVKLRQLIAEWSLILEEKPTPQFRTRGLA